MPDRDLATKRRVCRPSCSTPVRSSRRLRAEPALAETDELLKQATPALQFVRKLPRPSVASEGPIKLWRPSESNMGSEMLRVVTTLARAVGP